MADDLNILKNEFDDETLLNYLKGQLTPEEQHRIEEAMLESEELSDAMEGLEQFEDNKKLALIKYELERSLKKIISKRIHQRDKRKIKGLEWPVIFTFIILVLLLIAFIVIVF